MVFKLYRLAALGYSRLASLFAMRDKSIAEFGLWNNEGEGD